MAAQANATKQTICETCEELVDEDKYKKHMQSHLFVPYRREITDDSVEPEIMKFEIIVVKQEPEEIIDQDPPMFESACDIKIKVIRDGDGQEFDFNTNTAYFDFDEPENEKIQEMNFDSIKVKNENQDQVEAEEEYKGRTRKRKVWIEYLERVDESEDCEAEKKKLRRKRRRRKFRKSSDQQVSAKILLKRMEENCENIQDTSQLNIEKDSDVARPNIKCRVCKEQFTSREQYEIHFIADHNNPFACDQCGQNYKNRKSLLNHKALYHKPTSKHEVPVTCKMCNRTLKNRKSYNSHYAQYHNPTSKKALAQEIPVTCKMCNRTLKNRNSYNSHYELCHNPMSKRALARKVPVTCEICKKTLKNRNSYNSHVLRYHRSDPGKHCGKDLTAEMDKNCENIQDTSQSKIEEDPTVPRRTIKCRICMEQFTSREQYGAHITAAHNNPFVCDLCGRNYKSLRSLLDHMRTYHNPTSKLLLAHNVPVTCKVCNRTLKNRNSYNSHYELCHNPTSKRALARKVPVTCEICKKTFRNRNSYNSHVLLYHRSDPDNLTCKFCHKVFTLKRNLQIHIEAVHEKKAYECNVCKKTYSMKRAMYRHRKTAHGMTEGKTEDKEEGEGECDNIGDSDKNPEASSTAEP